MSTSTKPKWTIAGMSLALTLGACSTGGESDPTEGLPPGSATEGASTGSSADPTRGSADSTLDDSSGADTTDSEEPDSTGVEQCPPPPVPPSLVEFEPPLWCPDGFVFDEAYHLCAGETLARGPFSDPMVQQCLACGATACDQEDWPVELARGLRGTERCPSGAALSEDSLCVDDQYAWGPFPAVMVERCTDAGGGSACTSMRWDRAFAESLVPDTPLSGPWGYIMDLDYGIREDGYGGGHFGAPRSGNPGGHSGIDFLAPVGTPLLAPCDGPVWSGAASGYGNYVQLVCPIPDEIDQGAGLFGSMLFAHLDSISAPNGGSVVAGEVVGTVGKSGNAGAAGINAHLHFEIAIHGSEQAALGETHASANHSSNAAGDEFGALVEQHCWEPLELTPLTGPAMKGRRPDPFMALVCLVGGKPSLTPPPDALQPYLVPWSEHYDASDLDVDQ